MGSETSRKRLLFGEPSVTVLEQRFTLLWEPIAAKEAIAATSEDSPGNSNAQGEPCSGFNDLPDGFVPEDCGSRLGSSTLIGVEIASAECAATDLDQRFTFFQSRNGTFDEFERLPKAVKNCDASRHALRPLLAKNLAVGISMRMPATATSHARPRKNGRTWAASAFPKFLRRKTPTRAA